MLWKATRPPCRQDHLTSPSRVPAAASHLVKLDQAPEPDARASRRARFGRGGVCYAYTSSILATDRWTGLQVTLLAPLARDAHEDDCEQKERGARRRRRRKSCSVEGSKKSRHSCWRQRRRGRIRGRIMNGQSKDEVEKGEAVAERRRRGSARCPGSRAETGMRGRV